MGPNYSVIICSHNPRRDYFEGTLVSLRQQTLARERWELLLIDNRSDRPLANVYDLSWHHLARHIREEELGLTPARLRSIREARGHILVLVDDDNVLAPDFLERIEGIATAYPYLGVFGSGAVEPEFEVQPPPELLRLAAQHNGVLPLLALKKVSAAAWSNNPADRSVMPRGAGRAISSQSLNEETVSNGALFCVLANPVRPNARAFVTLPTALKRPNFDYRAAWLHGISFLCHHAASEILGNHR